MDIEVIRPTKLSTCRICHRTILHGFQVRFNVHYVNRSVHLECLNQMAKDILAGG